MIVGRTMWTQCTSVTDGQTELRSQRPRDAWRGKNRAMHGVARVRRKPSCRRQTRATLEILDTGHSRASKVTPFDILPMDSYCLLNVTLCPLKCTVFEILRHIGRKSPKKPTPLSFDPAVQRTPANICIKLMLLQTLGSFVYIFAADSSLWVYLHPYFCCGLRKIHV